MSSALKKTTSRKESSERRRQQNRQAQRNRRWLPMLHECRSDCTDENVAGHNMKIRMDHYEQLCSTMGIEPVSADTDIQPTQSPPCSHSAEEQDEPTPVLEVEDSTDSMATCGQSTPHGPDRMATTDVTGTQASTPVDMPALVMEPFDLGAPLVLDGLASYSFDSEINTAAPLPHDPIMEHGSLIGPRTSSEHTSSALHFAVNQRNREMVALLLTYGARVDVHDCHGETPLHLAVAMDDCDVLRTMLQASEKTTLPESAPTWVDVKNKSGLTPLHVTLSRGQTSAAQLLLAAGADPNQPMPIDQP